MPKILLFCQKQREEALKEISILQMQKETMLKEVQKYHENDPEVLQKLSRKLSSRLNFIAFVDYNFC